MQICELRHIRVLATVRENVGHRSSRSLMGPTLHISTRINEAWRRLLANTTEQTLGSAVAFRDWFCDDLTRVSAHLPPKLEQLRSNYIWSCLLERDADELPVRSDLWFRIRTQVAQGPPASDPARVFEWVADRLWRLLVYSHPEAGCGIDQTDLELWWSEETGRPLWVCGMDHCFEFQDGSLPSAPMTPWTGPRDELLPATKAVVLSYYPTVTLLERDTEANALQLEG